MKENSIRNTLKTYLKEHEGVTSKEAIEYIQSECGIDTSKEYIKSSFYNLRKELHYEKIRIQNVNTLKNAIRDYVLEHKNCVSNDEVVEYIIQECERENTKEIIINTLYWVLKETGGKLKKEKKVTLKQIIHEYVVEHNNYVSRSEVVEYVFSLGIETTKNSIWGTLRRVLNETGGELKDYQKRKK